MTMPNFTMRELLEAGIHFGHQKNRWNPKMEPYLFGERNGIHIIDLQQTFPLINTALTVLRDVGANGGRVLFVGTKRQAQKIVAESAVNTGQYYMNHRWLGGTLTNWKTISKSIVRLKSYDEILNKDDSGLTKKELVGMEKKRIKLELSLGGIKDMGGLPDALFVIDTNKEQIAIKEANVLKIPVIAVIDSNSNPDGVNFPIPGNDDATRAIALYCKLASEAILDGLQATFSSVGKDLGASEEIQENLVGTESKQKLENDNVKVDGINSINESSSDNSTNIEDLIDKEEKMEEDYYSYKIGNTVRMDGYSDIATILKIDNKTKRATIDFNNKKIIVKLKELSIASDYKTTKYNKDINIYNFDSIDSQRLDVRGKRVEEAIVEIDKFLDKVILSNLKYVEILHGKGTGALQEAIHSHLKKIKFISSYNYAPVDYGGTGITIIEIS